MPMKKPPLPDISLEQLQGMMAGLGVQRLLVKELAPNDNSKNQPYLSSNLDVTNILPSGDVYIDVTVKGNRIMKAPLPLEWLQPDGTSAPAPNAKLILYPQYPEVRFSGFLMGAKNAPAELLTTRMCGRLLFFGITFDRRVIGWCAGPESQLAHALKGMGNLEQQGVFRRVPLALIRKKSSRELLLEELLRIHRKDWIVSKALNQGGEILPCRASNCVGYTLEAELGVARNGRAEPDFEGWEVKASQVKDYNRIPGSKVTTLMTPEPTGGFYKERGVEAFVRNFGYKDKMGRENRMNFGGVHRVGELHPTTHLTLTLNGYDFQGHSITDPEGSLSLVAKDGTEAASWSFAALLGIWKRKHALAVFVPGEVRTDPERQYRFGNDVRLAEGTSLTYLVKALAVGKVYYDPGIKLENAFAGKPALKRRSQFRIQSKNLGALYTLMNEVDVLG